MSVRANGTGKVTNVGPQLAKRTAISNAIDLRVGEQITAAQMQAGLSWTQLAAKSQIKASVLATFAGGTARPSGRELLRIAYALQVPISALFSSTRH